MSTDNRFKKVTEPLNEQEKFFVASFEKQYENAELKLIQLKSAPHFLMMKGSCV